MNKFYLVAMLLGTVVVGSAHAQNFDNYDVKNTESLRKQTGFIALSKGQNVSVDSSTPSPIIVDNMPMSSELDLINPSSGVHVADPAQGQNTSVAVMPRALQQEVIVEETVMGNTDTGATPEEMAKYLDN